MRRLPLILATGLLLYFVAGCAESPATPAPTAVPSEAAPVVAAAPARPDAIRRMEDDFIAAEDLDQAAPTRRSIHERMAHYGVPGMGVAVINGGQLLWAGGYGTLSADGDEPVTADTVFSTGSVSKVAQAALVMRLVQAGRLDVDTDVSTYLTRWQVPDGPFTADGPVTLRAILSHTAGFSQHGFADFEPGEALPTALDTLNGAAPAKHGPVRLMFAPGTRMDYSGGGYTVSQVLVEDVTGRAYADLVRSEVFEPLGMSRSTFVNPLPPGHGNIARAHDSRGQPRALPRG
ncbi:MAG: serine hydrolase domain-containing protein, partial [Pseudomonadota bacterium]